MSKPIAVQVAESMAHPVGKWFVSSGLDNLRKPIFRLSRRPRWRSAHPDPHKGAGVERHFPPRVSECRSTVRPSSSQPHADTGDHRASAATNWFSGSHSCHFIGAFITYGPPRRQVVCFIWSGQSAKTYPASHGHLEKSPLPRGLQIRFKESL